ncbi:Lsr2 family protein [Marmoricola sp. URHB0036]|uniref:histone-like nucleoid-structuring protein Lsr2 n=1 Tax=Marmoricola sp. URHB0036 TaxID=1298863 RepID=UPI000481DE08|nr:Lsr2 family protein [Marmoricola sp. URHB0036]
MAKTTITQITDDLDGSKDAETYAFAWQGAEYEIDLSNKNYKALDKVLQPYIEAGTKVTKRSTSSRRSSSSKRDIAAVREWAKSQNLEVSERGRIPRAIIEAFDAAH